MAWQPCNIREGQELLETVCGAFSNFMSCVHVHTQAQELLETVCGAFSNFMLCIHVHTQAQELWGPAWPSQ